MSRAIPTRGRSEREAKGGDGKNAQTRRNSCLNGGADDATET